MIPLRFEKAYNIDEKDDENGYVQARISKAWNDFKHYVKIDHNDLLKLLS